MAQRANAKPSREYFMDAPMIYTVAVSVTHRLTEVHTHFPLLLLSEGPRGQKENEHREGVENGVLGG